MTVDPHVRRHALLERFRSAARVQLDLAMRACMVIDGEYGGGRDEAVAGLRRALQTIEGDAHMLGLDSLARFAALLVEPMARASAPSEVAVSQTLVGLEWLRAWSSDALIDDERAAARLAEGRAKLDEQAALLDEDEPSSASPGAGRTVLLVDDSALVRMMVEDSLLDAGFEVETAASGEQALRAVEASVPELVLSGVKMPGMTGFELLERLHGAHPELPVVLLSGVRSAADEARAQALGARGYLLKDADLGPLVAHVLEQVG